MAASCTFCSSGEIKDIWEHTISDSCNNQEQHIMMFASHRAAITMIKGSKEVSRCRNIAIPASDPESDDVGILPYAFYYSDIVFIGHY